MSEVLASLLLLAILSASLWLIVKPLHPLMKRAWELTKRIMAFTLMLCELLLTGILSVVKFIRSFVH